MKKVFYVIGIIIFLAICYIFVNFFYFDSWACHSSEKQLNNYVKHEDTKKLKEVAKDNKTYQFLKKQATNNMIISRFQTVNKRSFQILYLSNSTVFIFGISGRNAYLIFINNEAGFPLISIR